MFWQAYLLTINLLTLIIYGLDKLKAKKEAWRISEKFLLILAVLGGSVGALLGMLLFRHKKKKKKFAVGLPLVLLAQVVLLSFLLYQP